ncbi:MAG: hypothetical protein RL538_912 [Candidatus Parcubacteria bacterium]
MLEMKRNDVLNIAITFVVGFVAGGYLYVGHFSKLLNPDDVETQEEVSELSITSRAYGSCDPNCPSFQVSRDGAYRYLFVPAVGVERQVREGTIPFNIMRDIKSAIDSDVLVEQSQEAAPPDCNSRNGGIDVEYTIVFEGAEYELDSCGTTVDGEGELWTALAKIWNHFQTVQ